MIILIAYIIYYPVSFIYLSRPIKSENKGRVMLEKMGWTAGEGLGKTRSGRTEPVSRKIRLEVTL